MAFAIKQRQILPHTFREDLNYCYHSERKTMKHLLISLLSFFSILLLSSGCQTDSTEEIQFSIKEDFELETLYSPSESEHGSWVSIAAGPNGRYYSCDQYGDVYTFLMPDIGETLSSENVDSVDLNIGFAHGLLWAFESLYVVVVNGEENAKKGDPTSGVFRLQDSNGDGKLDTQEKILRLDGHGEHGPHTLRVSPDGESIYLIAGNFNTVPDHFTSRLPRTWGEDNVFPAYLDARGHANDIEAPGGWIARTDPEGKQWELVAAGFRNPFSLGFNQDGELFAYDADMEWDFGMPWYRPTRILHVVSGAEFGWRTGSGKWPTYYPDNLPSVVDLAQGSPTAVIMGKDLNFPTRFKRGLFACDWSFGTIYYVDLKPSGSTYTANKEEFLSGVPLPITNAIAGHDGHLYFLTGGRRLSSNLYRLRFTGQANTEDIPDMTNDRNSELRNLRRQLESHHQANSGSAIPLLWGNLSHDDRHIQYAARIGLEHQKLSKWKNKIYNEKNSKTIIQAAIALARNGSSLNSRLITTLEKIDFSSLSVEDKLSLTRAYALFLIRNNDISTSLKSQIAIKLSQHYPSTNDELNRELSQVLIKLEDENALAKTVSLLQSKSSKIIDADTEVLTTSILDRSEQYGPQIKDMLDNMPPTESIHYAGVLSHATAGWTKELREEYFEWYENAFSKKGGMSYKAFLDNMRLNALNNVPEDELAYFKEKSGFYSPLKEIANIAQPIGPGGSYNFYQVNELIFWDDELKNYTGTHADGERAFEAALCSSCHRMKGAGGANGPDLSNIHTRFKNDEIVSAILVPNEEISDQYAFTRFDLTNGDVISGKILKESDEAFTIYQSPYDMTQTTDIQKSDVKQKMLSSISPMPAKLLNRLNEQEVRDLMVYLISGADPEHEHYKKETGDD